MSIELGEPMGPVKKIGYNFFWSLVWIISKTFFRFRIVNKERVPKETAFILAPVHRSYIDSPVGGLVTKQRLRFLGKESIWNNRLGGWFMSFIGCFPVERGTPDRASLRACQEVLERGESMVMFPEGTRQSGPIIKFEKMHAGPAFVAARAGVPIVPLGISGTDRGMPPGARFIRPSKVYLVVGEPINPPKIEGRVPRNVVTEMTEDLHKSLQKAFDEAQRLNS